MLIQLKNAALTVTLSHLGAELQSVRRGDCEYIWQRDPAYWTGSAPILFPICGRLIQGKYTYGGKEYEMTIHGFAKQIPFVPEQKSETEVIFTARESAETLSVYPFPFRLTIEYRLEGDTLRSSITVENPGGDVLPYALGLHPGFSVPLDGQGSFADYVLEFGESCSPDQLVFSERCFQTGRKTAFPLEEGRRLALRHDLFDNDAIFLARIAPSVTLKSPLTQRFVRMEYPGMPYLGIWHRPHTEAPYVCIEPWCGLPSYDGVVDDFAVKSDMFRLQPGEGKTMGYAIQFG